MKTTYLKIFTQRLFSCLVGLAFSLFIGVGFQAIASEDGGSHSGGHDSGHSSKGNKGGGHDGGSGGHKGGHGGADLNNQDKGHHKSGQAVEDVVLRGRGRQPVWAKDGLPEVELGRLNVSRAPDHVLLRALSEARTSLATEPTAGVHSPPQNLALYWEAMSKPGTWTREETASFLGAASDKRIPITTDTVKALNIILGVSDSDPESMARSADSVRQQILADHDDVGESGGH